MFLFFLCSSKKTVFQFFKSFIFIYLLFFKKVSDMILRRWFFTFINIKRSLLKTRLLNKTFIKND